MADPATVQRTVNFYRIMTYPTAEGEVPTVQPGAICLTVGKLTFDEGDRYYPIENDQLLAAWDESRASQSRLRFGRIRRSALPQVEVLGETRLLDMEENEGILETIHVVFFPNGIIGAEFNFFGPRVSRLGQYVVNKCPELPPFTIERLVNREVLDQLDRFQDITLVRLRIPTSAEDQVREADASVAGMLRAAKQMGNSKTMEVVLRAERGESLGDRLYAGVRRIANSLAARDVTEVLKVKGMDTRTNHTEEIDLLKQYVVSRRQVVRQHNRSRIVDSTNMYEQINLAYKDSEDDIKRAVTTGDGDGGEQ